MIPVIDLGIR